MKYRSLFETAIDPIIVVDTKGLFVDVNQQVTNLLGYRKEDLIGKDFHKIGILTEESIVKIRDDFKRRMSGEDVPPYEVKLLQKMGK